MLKKNKQHLQKPLISAVQDLPENQRERLEHSWAGTFYNEFFTKVDEGIFADIYSDLPSRPNIPVNVLIGLEVLKAGFGWSDEEMYERYLYDVQVRYAVGYTRLGEGEFDIRTVYNFRQRLSGYNLKHGVNLIERVFEGVTDKQIIAMKLNTGHQRMDSTQIASNIMDASRLHLLVEGIRRLHRLVDKGDQKRLEEWFEPYIQETAGHYAYRVKGKEATWEQLEKVGPVLYTLLSELKDKYGDTDIYRVVERLFGENYHHTQAGVHSKENQEIPSGSLQSLDDLEATYRVKGNKHYKGYVANISETCDPVNPVQLITKVQVASNNTADSKFLNEALPNLKQRTQVDTLTTDGAYACETNDEVLRQQEVRLIQTGICGNKPDRSHYHLADFQLDMDEEGNPSCITCPNGQSALPTRGRTTGWFVRFPAEVCSLCPDHLTRRCRAKPQKKDKRYYLDFTLAEARIALRRQNYRRQKEDEHNLRASVEATVRSLKHPFPAGKLPVRGKFRVECMMISSAILINVRRICYFVADCRRNEVQKSAGDFFVGVYYGLLRAIFGFIPSYSRL